MSGQELSDALIVGDRVHHPVRGLGTVSRVWQGDAAYIDAVSVLYDFEPDRVYIAGADHVCKVGS